MSEYDSDYMLPGYQPWHRLSRELGTEWPEVLKLINRHPVVAVQMLLLIRDNGGEGITVIKELARLMKGKE